MFFFLAVHLWLNCAFPDQSTRNLAQAQERRNSNYIVNEISHAAPPVAIQYFHLLGAYLSTGGNSNKFNADLLNQAVQLYSTSAKVDINEVADCLIAHTARYSEHLVGNNIYEHNYILSDITSVKNGVHLIEFVETHLVIGGLIDNSSKGYLLVFDGKVAGYLPNTGQETLGCWVPNTAHSSEIAELLKSDNLTNEQSKKQKASEMQASEPIKSTGSNKWDLIRDTDPSVFNCLVYLGRKPEEIFDKRIDKLVNHHDAFLYVAYFGDGTSIDIRVHPEFETAEEAENEVNRYTKYLGQLPTIARMDIKRLAIMKGNKTAMADGGGEGIHIHSGNAALRDSHNRLQETLFHEAMHTSLDDIYSTSDGWQQAQKSDGKYLTIYGRERPEREDFAESALYIYALIHHPERIPEEYREIIQRRIPNRIKYIRSIFPNYESIFTKTNFQHKECAVD